MQIREFNVEVVAPSIPAAACAEWVTERVWAAGVMLADTLSPAFCATMIRHCCSTLLSWSAGRIGQG